ncbi:SH3 domain-containing protein [Halalkalibacter okhensis]|uniref:Uncharacterized protein n=1 Tax=Halalkalibacter okhensis TaxID=333138 RepID=A0A0B0IDN6_9BACI|nr:SH3 domain-containing protein [Halalkalibacter okhensis]KHF40713.1 hypothetical protein LQ50_07935 [Halalkalibacter okhensis]
MSNNLLTDFLNASEKIGKFMFDAQEALLKFSAKVSPVILFLVENQVRIDNFMKDYKKLDVFYDGNIEDMPLNEMPNFVKALHSEGKIIINEDWSIELVKKQSLEEKKSTSLDSVNKILGTVLLALEISNGSIELATNVKDFFNQNDNPVIIEQPVRNEYLIMTEDLNLHSQKNNDSDSITSLSIGMKVHVITTDEEWSLVGVLNEANEMIYNGWLESKYINPAVK